MLNLNNYDFNLPKKLIANQPANPRDSSRLLAFNRNTKKIIDDVFRNIDKYLVEGTTLVFNETKVDKCRLKFDKKEMFILEELSDDTFWALVFPGKSFKPGKKILLSDNVIAQVLELNQFGHRKIRLNIPINSPTLDGFRRTPLPPYIKQDDNLDHKYQTVYAKTSGSKAAPTAGLHFTSELLDKLNQAHQFAKVDLTVSLGTFAPINDENIKVKQLHTEKFFVTEENLKIINNSKHRTAVGTTTARTLETLAINKWLNQAKERQTNIFIQPGDDFLLTDSLITNFHLPKSSLLMMIAAFMGYEEMRMVYDYAIKNEYRFFSFGDSMLIV